MSSFTWWFINLGISFIWLAIGIKSESWFLVLGSIVYLGIAFLVELPDSSLDTRWDEDEDDQDGLLS